MKWAQRGFFELTAIALFICLLATAVTFSISHTFNEPAKIKTWLAQSGIYDQIVTNTINSAQDSIAASSDTSGISLRDPEIQDVARSVVTPQLVQSDVETFVDSNYAWLKGQTETPEFKIDLTQTKQQFAQQAGASVRDYLAKLPTCTADQLKQLSTSGAVNPLSLACRPPTINTETTAAQVTQQLATGPFIDNPVITADSIGNSYGIGSDQPYYEQLSQAPAIYKISKYLPIVFVGLTVLSALLLFTISRSVRIILKRIASASFIAGILLLCIKVVADFIINKVEQHVFTNQNASLLEKPITTIVHAAEQSIVRIDLYIGIGYVTLAIVLFAYLLLTRSKSANYSELDSEPYDIPQTAPIQTTAPVEQLEDTVRQTTPTFAEQKPEYVPAQTQVKKTRPAMDFIPNKPPTIKSPEPIAPSPVDEKPKPRPRRRLIQ